MFERFTRQARAVVVDAQHQARLLGHGEVRAEHVLLGVLAADAGAAGQVLRDLGVRHERVVDELASLGAADGEALRAIGVDLGAIRERVEAAFGPGALDLPRPRVRRGGLRGLADRFSGHLRFTAPAKRALEQSLRQALDLGDDHIGTDHILLGLVADDADPASRLLARLGVDPAALRTRVRDQRRRAA